MDDNDKAGSERDTGQEARTEPPRTGSAAPTTSDETADEVANTVTEDSDDSSQSGESGMR